MLYELTHLPQANQFAMTAEAEKLGRA
jgi:hypothetical protein